MIADRGNPLDGSGTGDTRTVQSLADEVTGTAMEQWEAQGMGGSVTGCNSHIFQTFQKSLFDQVVIEIVEAKHNPLRAIRNVVC